MLNLKPGMKCYAKNLSLHIDGNEFKYAAPRGKKFAVILMADEKPDNADGIHIDEFLRNCGWVPASEELAITDIIAERQRQITAKGWTPDHDDKHVNDEIAALAALYAMPEACRDWPAKETGYGASWAEAICPNGWVAKFGDRRRDLVKAAALIIAEIERIDRAGS